MLIKLLEILAWPSVALISLFVIRPVLIHLLSGSKIKMSLGGASIETTLPEMKEIISEQVGGALSSSETNILLKLSEQGEITYETGNTKEDRRFLRPLRNAGLIMTIPRNAYLSDANSIQLTALGRLYVRAIKDSA